MYSYFRVSTISVVCGTGPLVIIILSVFLIGEKFYMRYIIGVFLDRCFIPIINKETYDNIIEKIS